MVVADGRWEPTLVTLDGWYDQETSVHHPQLKDLITCEDKRTIYCVHGRSTIKYDTSNGKSSTVQSLNFAPICMTVGYGYVAAGGPSKELDVRRLSDGHVAFAGNIDGTVNNSLLIEEGPVGLLLFVCNNDETVKIFSLPSMETYSTLKFPVSMNYAAVSHGCEYLVSVGDSAVTYLHQATPTGYRKIGELCNYQDVGMCCCWDSQGVCFAAASQGGTTCVWDRRNHNQLVASFHTENQQACRNVKFSSAPMDLLAFTEENRFCHLIDARNMSRRQLLKIEPDVEHDISGLCFSPNGSYVFVGTTNRGIYGYSVDTAARRRFSEGSII